MDFETNLIGEIYASALHDVPWTNALAQVMRATGASGAHLFTTFIPVEEGGITMSLNLPADVVAKYLNEVATVDVWYHELLRRHPQYLPTGLIYESENLVPAARLVSTRFYSDYLIPCDIGTHLGTILGSGAEADLPATPLSLYRPVGRKGFTQDAAVLMRRLQPHFTQALRIRQQVAFHKRRYGALAIEACAQAVVIITPGRRVLFANAAADALFARRPTCISAGRLTADTPAENIAIERAAASAVALRFAPGGPAMVFRLAGIPGAGVLARVAPVPADRSTPVGGALAFLSEESTPPRDIVALVAAAYKLTAAETLLVRGLVAGRCPDEIAEDRQVALATVKAQLRSVFSKTGMRRQADLIRLFFSIAS